MMGTHGRKTCLFQRGLTGFLVVFVILLGPGRMSAAEYENMPISPVQLEALLDPLLKPYAPDKTLTGHIRSAERIDSEGSDTVSNKLVYVAQGFNDFHPEVKIHFQTHGSLRAAEALTQGRAQLGPMSRPMSLRERRVFTAQFGYPPTRITVARDAVAVFVHESNPLVGLTLETVARIFSRQAPHAQIRTWGDLFLGGPWKDRRITIYGRNENSGTRAFFQENALKGQPYREEIQIMPGNRAVVQGVAGGLLIDPNGVGYASIAYLMKGVRPLQLAADESSPVIDPNYINIQKGFYPLQRSLYIYINKPPDKRPDPVVEEFIRFTLSRNGQILLAKGGFVPITAAEIEIQLKKLAPEADPAP